MTDAVLAALAAALARDPDNGPLWRHYGELLAATPRAAEAITALRRALELGEDPAGVLVALIPLLRGAGMAAEALIRAEEAVKADDDEALRALYDALRAERGEDPSEPPARAQAQAGPGMARAMPAELAERLAAPPEPPVTFADVAGLADVKKQIQLRIVAPFKTPGIFAAFKRKAGGGLLLYGPPGCGKTFVARATAGEVGARFISVGVADLVDAHWGESEKAVRALFAEARSETPTVLFFDEFDALGAARGGTESQFWRALVTQLLTEMDGVDGPNEGVLVMAATNLPWAVDPAFRRPGRFDRVVFVPPPDEAARLAILRVHAAGLPGGETLDLAAIARATGNWSGADLKALCERAAEAALERSLETGKIQPVAPEDFKRALADSRPSAAEWFASARNHVKYANEGGRYDDLGAYMKAHRLS